MRLRLAAGLLLLAASGCEKPAERAEAPPPSLFLLTGLPLVFGESFTLSAPASPIMTALDQHYRVRLVDGAERLPPEGVLLAAQPRALTAERLVALDGWVRGGGRLVLLADPRLTWPSDLPLGDRRRPPYAFADTGLLAHWGLVSEAPDPRAGSTASIVVAGQAMHSDSPGRLRRVGGTCTIAADKHSAECALGRGRALVVADADFLRSPEGPEALVAMLAAVTR